MKRYLLCRYEPTDPDSKPKPVGKQFQPSSRREARGIIAAYNELVERDPDLTTVLALFPKSAIDQPRYRLALYDPVTGKRGKWEGPRFQLGTDGERQARVAIEEFNRLTADNASVTLNLGAFPVRGKAVPS